MILTDFYEIVDLIVENALIFFNSAHSMIFIDDLPLSVFEIMVGFVVLELIMAFLNSFRGRGVHEELEEEYTPHNYRYPAHRHARDYRGRR